MGKLSVGKKLKKGIAVLLALLMVASVCSPVSLKNLKAADTPDLKDYITSIQINEKNGSTWVVSDGTVTDGESIQILITYKMLANVIGANKGYVATYQLPTTVKISSEQTGKVYSGSTEVGKYTIDTYGKVTITYTQDTDKLNPTKDFDGTLTFECEADLSNQKQSQALSFEGTSTMTPTEVTVVPGSDAYDIATSKSAGDYDAEAGTITYTVTVSTTNGTRGTVSVTDNMWVSVSGLAEYDTDTVKVVKNDNTTITSGSISTSGSNTQNLSLSISDLPQLNAGETYTITYTVKVTDSILNGDGTVSNSATASSTDTNNITNKSTSTSVSKTITHKMLEKTSTVSGDTITWKIKINEAGDDIGEMTLKDVLRSTSVSDVTKGTITSYSVTKTTNGSVTEVISQIPQNSLLINGSGYTFPSGDTSTYTITYSYKTQNSNRKTNESYTNTVTLGNYSTSNTETIGASDNLTKSYDTMKNQTSNGATYEWKLNVTKPDTFDANKTYITDSLADYLVIKEGASFSGLPTTGATVTFYDATREECGTVENGKAKLTDASTEAKSFKITFSDEWTENFTLTYETYGSYSGMNKGETREFKNTATFTWDGTPQTADASTTSYTYMPKIIKYVKGAIADYQTSNSTSFWYYSDGAMIKDLNYSNLSNGQLEYLIAVNVDGSLKDTTQDVTVTDALPDGVTLDTSSVRLYLYGAVTLSDNTVSYLGTENNSNYISVAETSGTVTFTIANAAFTNNSNVAFISYAVTVPNSTGTVLYSNTASLGTNNSSTVSQNVVGSVSGGQVVSKSGKQLTDSTGSYTNEIKYMVDVNKGALDLNSTSDELTLTDSLSAQNAQNLKSIELKSVTFYNYNETYSNADSYATSGTVIGSGCSYTRTIDAGNGAGTIQFTVPDKMAIHIEYIYRIEYSSAQAASPNITNTITLTLDGQQYTANDQISYNVSSSSATAGNKPSLTLYKTDSSNVSLKLSGATFELSAFTPTWNATSTSVTGGTWGTTTEYTITATGLNLTTDTTATAGSDTAIVSERTLYKLVETKSPNGYQVSKDPIYLIFGSSATNTNDTPTSLKTWATTTTGLLSEARLSDAEQNSVRYYVISGATDSIDNDLATTSLVVKKKWLNADGSEITPSASSVSVQLYQQVQTATNQVAVTVEGYFGQTYDNSTGQTTWTAPITDTFYVEKGTSMTVQWDYGWNPLNTGWTATKTESGAGTGTGTDITGKVTENESTAVYTYTFAPTTDVTITLQGTSTKGSTTITAPTMTSPTYTNRGGEQAYGTVQTLNSSNNWTVTYETLSAGDASAGMKYLYYVKETAIDNTDISTTNSTGYTVSYSSNNNPGVTGGETIYVNNTSTTQIDTAAITLGVQKQIDGETNSLSSYSSGFKFQLTEQTLSGSAYSDKTGGTTGAASTDASSGTGSFDKISYTSEGTYYYKISEVTTNPQYNDLDYDDSYYIVTVSVADTSGSLTANVTDIKKYAANGTVSDSSVDTSKASALVFNNTTKTGSLTVKKIVEGVTGTVPSGTKFTLTITLAKDGTSTGINATYGGVEFKNGVGTVTLSADESVTITGIPCGYTYTVTEDTTSNPKNYGRKTGEQDPTGTIADAVSTATITNVYSPASISISKKAKSGTTELSGATLTLYSGPSASGTSVASWVTGTEAKEILIDETISTSGEYDGTIRLVPGTYTLVETSAPTGYAYADNITFRVDADGTITSAGSSSSISGATITMTDTPISDLTISKYDITDGTNATMLAGATLQLWEIHGGGQDVQVGGNWTSDGTDWTVNGSLLKAGQSYSIIEKNAPNGYTTSEAIDFTIGTDGEITNISSTCYDAETDRDNFKIAMGDAQITPAQITIPVTKTVENAKSTDSKVFSFVMEPASGNPTGDPLAGKTCTISMPVTGDSGSGVLAPDKFETAGTYIYYIYEGSAGTGYTYDTSVYKVEIEVTNTNGTLAAGVTSMMKYASMTAATSGTGGTDCTSTGVSFTNTYNLIGQITVNKTISGATAADVTIGLYEVVNGTVATAPTQTTTIQSGDFKSTGNGDVSASVTFADLDITKTYAVYEIDDDGPVIGASATIDGTSFTVAYTTNNNTSITLNAANTYAATVDITNTHQTADISITPTATKKFLDGSGANVAQTAGAFTFRLSNVAYNGKTDTGFTTLTETNTADGKVTFADITYSAADAGQTYQYLLQEVSGTDSMVEYDTQTYTLLVAINKDTNGDLQATQTWYKGASVDDTDKLGTNETPTFTNYQKTGASATFGATKTVTNKTLEEKEYTFTLTAVDASKKPLGSAAIQATNDATGAVAFGAISYTAAGTYYYSISEQTSTNAGIVCDTTVYYVKTVVTYDAGAKAYTAAQYRFTGGANDLLTSGTNWTAYQAADVTFANYATKISVSKTDTAGTALLKATLQLVNKATGAEVVSWESGSEPYELVAKLAPGVEYVLKETKAPDGYEVASDITLKLSNDGRTLLIYNATTQAWDTAANNTVVMIDTRTAETSTTSETTTTEATTEDTEDTEETTETTTTHKPKTGDDAPIVPIAILLILSAAGAGATLVVKRKNRRR